MKKLQMDEIIHDVFTNVDCAQLENKISCADTFIISLGILLAKNLDNTIDRPIYYASQLMSNVEKNYTTTRKEA
jgi:hypothetical protein